MKVGSLFTGIGGLDQAVESVFGAATAWQVEIDPFCQEVLRARYPKATLVADVREADPSGLQDVDVLCSSSPCQDLSVAGKNAGLRGKRSALFFETLRFVKAKRPRLVFFENVPHLYKYRDEIDVMFFDLGYGIAWQKLQARDAGYPHRRSRIFALAMRGAKGSTFVPRPKPGPELFRTAATPANGKVWPTPTAGFFNQNPEVYRARFAKHKARGFHCGKPLNIALIERFAGEVGSKLINPDWVETLMGYRVGWSDPDRPLGDHVVPAGPEDERDPSEPPYLAKPTPIFAKRMKALGNSVVAPQAALALSWLHARLKHGI